MLNEVCAAARQASAPTPPIELTEPLADHLSKPARAYQSRVMLRSWFLTYVLEADNCTTFNDGTLADNVYLYEVLDDFLSSLYKPVIVVEP